MIDAKDLMIGNWLRREKIDLNGGGNVLVYEKITSKEIHSIAIHFDDDMYFPIPLTLEIFDKCGFENNYGDFKLLKNNINIENKGGSWWYINGIEINPVDSLHQLQNLYFALIGEELSINL